MWDPRIVMDLVHRYGRACGEHDHARAGVLYAQIVRALADDETAPPPDGDGAAAVELAAVSSAAA